MERKSDWLRGTLYATVVFPIADLRQLLCADVEIVRSPFQARDCNAYLRRFGPASYRTMERAAFRFRNSAGENGQRLTDLPPPLISDEDWFISAKRFARISVDAARQPLNRDGATLPIREPPPAPRLFADGLISARLEISALIDYGENLAKQSLKEICRLLLAVEVETRASRPGKRAPARQRMRLGALSKPFREAYLAATLREPLRAGARAQPDEAEKLKLARSALVATEPLVVLVMPSQAGALPQLEMDVLRDTNGSFRVLTVSVGDIRYGPLLRQARRSFVRLHSEGCAVIRLVQRWRSEGTLPSEDVLRRLVALSNRLYDAQMAIVSQNGRAIPFMGEIAQPLAEAVEQLGSWLDGIDPNAGRTQRRFAKTLVADALVANPSNGVKLEVKMGDIFSNITNSTILNHSVARDAFNSVRAKYDDDTAHALMRITEEVHASGNKDAGELVNRLNEEAAKPQPTKPVLKAYWDGLVAVLPSVAKIAGAAAAIAKLLV